MKNPRHFFMRSETWAVEDATPAAFPVPYFLYSTAFAAIAALYHSALSFGVRVCVLKST
jgi:hypothetical protein